jgi:hypothetical protein
VLSAPLYVWCAMWVYTRMRAWILCAVVLSGTNGAWCI